MTDDPRYQIACDIGDESTNTASIFANNCNIGYYLPANHYKYHVFTNESHEVNPDMYLRLKNKVENGEIDYVGVLLSHKTGKLLLQSNGGSDAVQTQIEIDIYKTLLESYSVVGTYTIDGKRDIRVFKSPSLN